MLDIRPHCEGCGRPLAEDSVDAYVCSYACTWCRECADGPLERVCPNCGGELVRRQLDVVGRELSDATCTFRPR